jgi:hypothetical protein
VHFDVLRGKKIFKKKMKQNMKMIAFSENSEKGELV